MEVAKEPKQGKARQGKGDKAGKLIDTLLLPPMRTADLETETKQALTTIIVPVPFPVVIRRRLCVAHVPLYA